MHSAWTSLQKDSLFVGQSSIDDAHSELTVEVGEGAHASHEEIYVVIFNVVGQEAFDSDDFDLVSELWCDLPQ